MVTNEDAAPVSGSLTSRIFDRGSNVVATIVSSLNLAAGSGMTLTQAVAITNVRPWSPQSPSLYTLVSTVSNQTTLAGAYETSFGVRTISVDPDLGVILNGEPIEIRGMCNHQDHAGVGIEFIRRTSTGGSSSANSVGGLTAPYWVRLTRTNNTFVAWRSPNGISWTPFGTNTINFAGSNAYAGLAVNSHNNSVLNTAVFDNLSISSTTLTPPSPSGVLTYTWDGTSLILDSSQGVLCTATNVQGPWTPVFAPFPCVVTPTNPLQFYRLRIQ